MSISRRQLLASTAGLAASGILGGLESNNIWGQPTPKRVGLALTIGVNRVSPQHYPSQPEVLGSCVNDAQAMAKIATDAGFDKVLPLHDDKATRYEVSRHIYHAALRLKAGDLFLITVSGHGFTGAIGDTADLEDDGKDEGWCLYDWMMVDDELFNLWQLFQQGVRILAFADTCHSGTSAKVMNYAKSLGLVPSNKQPDLDAVPHGPLLNPKSLPKDFAVNSGKALRLPPESPAIADILYPSKSVPAKVFEDTYQNSKADYDAVQKSVASHLKASDTMYASGLLIASSQDHQPSYAGDPFSAFTREVIEVWKNPPPSYKDLYTAVHGRLRWQTPNWYPFGVFDPKFHSERPFTV
jgi:metacaspase-1